MLQGKQFHQEEFEDAAKKADSGIAGSEEKLMKTLAVWEVQKKEGNKKKKQK